MKPALPLYTFIIPVYGRASLLRALLHSLCAQRDKDFNVLVVEDDARAQHKALVQTFETALSIRYRSQTTSGPGRARTHAARLAHTPYLVFVDSDTLLPQDYTQRLHAHLQNSDFDLAGGPDTAVPDASLWQKTLSYCLNALCTTGGIRGARHAVEKFLPRTHNMIVGRACFEALNGFSKRRYGEDIEFSLRARQKGYKLRFLADLRVHHHRKPHLGAFLRQVYHAGQNRVELARTYPEALSWVHAVPFACVVAGLAALYALTQIGWTAMYPFLLYALAVFAEALCTQRNLPLACMAIPVAATQIIAYGMGWAVAWIKRIKPTTN